LPKKKQTKQLVEKPKQKLNAYAKYSTMALQMGVIITIGAFGGLKIDQYFDFSFPIFTLSLSIISVFLAVYLAIKDIIKYND